MNRIIRVLLGCLALLAVLVSPVSASHTHVMALGNGQCVLLAAKGGEDAVVPPLSVFERNPNVVVPSTGAAHPLHVLVHRGVPGTTHPYAVYGLAQGNALCSAGIVND